MRYSCVPGRINAVALLLSWVCAATYISWLVYCLPCRLRTRRVGTRGITNRVAHTGWQGRGVLGISHGATDIVPKPSRISLLPMNSARGQATVLSQVMSSHISVFTYRYLVWQRSRRSRSCTPALVRTDSQLERMFTVPPALFRVDSHTGETEKISTSGQKHEQMVSSQA